MFALTDIWNTILHIVHSADTIQLILMAIVVLVSGFVMAELSSIISTAVIAVIVYVILNFLRAIILQHADVSGLLTADWKAFETMSGLLILSYGIMFGVIIAIVSTIRRLVLG